MHTISIQNNNCRCKRNEFSEIFAPKYGNKQCIKLFIHITYYVEFKHSRHITCSVSNTYKLSEQFYSHPLVMISLIMLRFCCSHLTYPSSVSLHCNLHLRVGKSSIRVEIMVLKHSHCRFCFHCCNGNGL